MKIEEMNNRITELLASNSKPFTTTRITTELKLKGKERKMLQKCLHKLLSEGRICKNTNNRYSLGKSTQLLSGQIDITRSGNGFLSAETDILVQQDNLNTALPGDKVLVKLNTAQAIRNVQSRPTGSVVSILERAKHDVVGTLKAKGKLFHVIPIDPSYKKPFHVVDTKGAFNNDRVVARFVSWKTPDSNPEAEIIETLGPDSPSIDTQVVIRHYQFREQFPNEVTEEADAASSLISRPGQRTDLRDKFIITIDPATARDFDDALSIDVDQQGNKILGVHIADVSHFVTKGGPMDEEALTRGNSVYFPDKVIPMLPEKLSNGICSLRPNEDRLAFSVFMTFDKNTRIIKRSFARTIIRSRARLTYEQAMASLKASEEKRKPVPGIDNHTAELLTTLGRLARRLRKQRFASFALNLDMPDCQIQIGDDGMMTGIKIVPNDLSHQLVEECMVAANEAVAAELHTRGIPCISRLHQPPTEEKIQQLTIQLQELDLKPGDLSQRQNLASFLKSITDLPIAYHVRTLVLKSMRRALYSHLSEGHFGLAKRFYAHFTSPIRRYPDLVVHRQLAAAIERNPAQSDKPEKTQATKKSVVPYDLNEIKAVAENCSRTEQTADEAEKTLLEIKKYRFLAQELENKQNVEYDAVIVNVMNFGMFVELRQLQIQGLVHVSAISDRFVKFSSKTHTLRAGKTVYSVGKYVKVFPANVDFDNRRIDFALA